MIPVAIMEEHNEAFLAWTDAVAAGYIPPAGNLLLHVDEHADMRAPRLRTPLHRAMATPESRRRLTYDELAIFEFIVPAVHQGLFDTVHWMMQSIPAPLTEERATVYSPDGLGRILRMDGLPPGLTADGRSFLYRTGGTRVDLPEPHGSVVLDIDLDWFSCEETENTVHRMEVTRAEFDRFHADPLHFMRLSQGARVAAEAQEGRYYITARNYGYPFDHPKKVPPHVIDARVELLRRWLLRNAVRPRFITIARSRLSGFTPADQVAYIEDVCLSMLDRLWGIAPRIVGAAADAR